MNEVQKWAEPNINLAACKNDYCIVAKVPANNANAFWSGIGLGLIVGVGITLAVKG